VLLLLLLVVLVVMVMAPMFLVWLLVVMVVIVGRLDLAFYRRYVQVVEHELVDVFVGQPWIVSFHVDVIYENSSGEGKRVKKYQK